MKKTTKPKVTIASLKQDLEKHQIESKNSFEVHKTLIQRNVELEAENKKYQDGITKLEVLNNELKKGVNDLLKEYNDLEVQSTASDLTLAMIKGILDCGYNLFTAYSTVNKIKSILNSK